MGKVKVFVSGILGGLCVSIGATVFLSLDNKIAGSLLFTAGLYTICVFGLNLFTGKVCYLLDNGRSYAVDLVFIWLGNLAGAVLTARLERVTRIGNALAEKAAVISDLKLNDSLLSVFILGIFCNILIYIGVENFRSNPHELGKYLGLFFGISVFILCGFEHCVANMYYFALGDSFADGRAWLCLISITLGNLVGGILIPVVRKWLSREV